MPTILYDEVIEDNCTREWKLLEAKAAKDLIDFESLVLEPDKFVYFVRLTDLFAKVKEGYVSKEEGIKLKAKMYEDYKATKSARIKENDLYTKHALAIRQSNVHRTAANLSNNIYDIAENLVHCVASFSTDEEFRRINIEKIQNMRSEQPKEKRNLNIEAMDGMITDMIKGNYSTADTLLIALELISMLRGEDVSRVAILRRLNIEPYMNGQSETFPVE